MEKRDSNREPFVERISSPVAAGAILLGLFVAMSLLAGGIIHYASPQEAAAAVPANPSSNPAAPATGPGTTAGAGESLPQREDTNAYAD